MNMHMVSECIFCRIDASRIIFQSQLVYAIRDAYPISPGHTLIIPRRHIGSFFEVNTNEQTEILDALRSTRTEILQTLMPSGFNIGINDGESAGQTVPHLHIHLIPRYTGDQEDPRGGVRWIFPGKAAYWSTD